MKLKDIAKLANVSPATVSMVLNDRPGVSNAKREQILQLLDEYGYSVHASSDVPAATSQLCRNLRLIKCKRHAMLVDGNPGFVNAIVDAIELECRRQGLELMITTCSIEQLHTVIRQIRAETTAGILLLGTELSTSDVQAMPVSVVPMIILDSAPHLSDVSCITMDNYDAIYCAVDHLVSYGHKQIGFFANQYPANNCLERERAFPEALRRHNLVFDPNIVYRVHPTPDGAYQSVREMLANGVHFPSAMVANNDSIALGAIKAMKEAGLDIPGDVSVVGFDNIPLSSITDPPLTTMDVPCNEMGIWAVRLLCDRIKYPSSSSIKMQLSTKLLVRSSTTYCNSKRRL